MSEAKTVEPEQSAAPLGKVFAAGFLILLTMLLGRWFWALLNYQIIDHRYLWLQVGLAASGGIIGEWIGKSKRVVAVIIEWVLIALYAAQIYGAYQWLTYGRVPTLEAWVIVCGGVQLGAVAVLGLVGGIAMAIETHNHNIENN